MRRHRPRRSRHLVPNKYQIPGFCEAKWTILARGPGDPQVGARRADGQSTAPISGAADTRRVERAAQHLACHTSSSSTCKTPVNAHTTDARNPTTDSITWALVSTTPSPEGQVPSPRPRPKLTEVRALLPEEYVPLPVGPAVSVEVAYVPTPREILECSYEELLRITREMGREAPSPIEKLPPTPPSLPRKNGV